MLSESNQSMANCDGVEISLKYGVKAAGVNQKQTSKTAKTAAIWRRSCCLKAGLAAVPAASRGGVG